MKPFPWRAGMRCYNRDFETPCRIVAILDGEALAVHENTDCPLGFIDDLSNFSGADLADDATIGAFRGAVRAAWKCDAFRRLDVETAGAGFCVVLRNGRHCPPSRAQPAWELDTVAHPRYRNMPRPFLDEYPTEGAALLAAWEAAP